MARRKSNAGRVSIKVGGVEGSHEQDYQQKTMALKVHYAFRVFRSVRYLGETTWQPICGISDIAKIRMSTRFVEVTCKNCRNQLIKNKRRLGIGRQINKILRHGDWYEPAE